MKLSDLVVGEDYYYARFSREWDRPAGRDVNRRGRHKVRLRSNITYYHHGAGSYLPAAGSGHRGTHVPVYFLAENDRISHDGFAGLTHLRAPYEQAIAEAHTAIAQLNTHRAEAEARRRAQEDHAARLAERANAYGLQVRATGLIGNRAFRISDEDLGLFLDALDAATRGELVEAAE